RLESVSLETSQVENESGGKKTLLRTPIVATVPTTFALQNDLANLNPFIQRLAHIVKGEGCHACSHESFHFHPGFRGGRDLRSNSDAILAQRHIDINERQGQRMAH